MTTYHPQGRPELPGSRPPCATCGAAYRLHRPPAGAIEYATPLPGPGQAAGLRYLTRAGLAKMEAAGLQLECPEAYRPDTLEVARRELAQAEASGDEARVFVARGNLQRLEGRR